MAKTLIVVDGHNQAFRQYFGSKDPDKSTAALTGLFHVLQSLLFTSRPRYMAVALDSVGPSWRANLFPAYKAHRAKRPDELEAQVPYFHHVASALGITAIRRRGYEADDVVAGLASMCTTVRAKMRIISSDKDLAQLVTDDITIQDTYNSPEMDYTGVKEKFGVQPHQIREYLALVGDKTDNIPGVPGIGAVKAAAMLKRKSIKQIAADETDHSRERRLLLKHLDQARLSYRLASLKTPEVPDLSELQPAMVPFEAAQRSLRDVLEWYRSNK